MKPTPEQLKILTDTDPGYRLIRGSAGSGKTTVALMRIRQLCSARLARKRRLGHSAPIRVLALTFNRTLRGYIEYLAKAQVAASGDLDLTVDTFSRWATRLCTLRRNVGSHRELIRRRLTRAGISADLDYFVDEVEYILGRFPPDDRGRYLSTQRTGRGRTPAIDGRQRAKLLNEVIEPYDREKDRRAAMDWNDVALETATVASQDYDVVVVDETQDLSANQVRAVLAHLNRDHTTTFIMDSVQRIYPQVFSWREVGVIMRPHMVFTLTENHRNTVEIAGFAASILHGLPEEDDGVLPCSSASQRHGPRPKLVVGTFRRQLEYMLDKVKSALLDGETVAILHPKGGHWFDFTRRTIRSRNIPFCELTRQSEWPEGSEQVALSTMHSAKGLEFDHVLMPGLNREVTAHREEVGHGTFDSLRRLTAMSVGRARKTVAVGYKPGEQSTLVSVMDRATYDMIEVD